jgi:hypothetical protein
LRQKRKSAAVGRSEAQSERSENVSFIEQLGGGDVREAPSRTPCSLISPMGLELICGESQLPFSMQNAEGILLN